MRKLQYLIFIIIITCCSLAAQPEMPTASWGKEYNEPAGSRFVKVITANESGFYALRKKSTRIGSGRDKYIVEKYNGKMNLLKAQELPLKHKKKWLEFEDVIVLNGKFYMLSSFHNDAKKRNYLFAQEIARKSLSLRPSMVKIGETTARNSTRKGEFDTHISKDSSKVMVVSRAAVKRNEKERFALSVYNKELKEYWSRDIELPYASKDFIIENYRVDNNGNAYILGVLYTDGVRVRRKGLPTYEYIILAYRKEIAEPEEYRIKNEQKFITDLTFRIGKKGNIVCSGFYSEKGTYSVKGSYFSKISVQEHKLVDEKFTEFDFNFLTANMSKRQKDKAQAAEVRNDSKREPELFEYKLDELILRSDGGAVLVAEQFFVEEYRDFDNTFSRYNYNNTGNYQSRYEYHYNDIIVLNIRPDGSHQWAARIPKRQVTVNDNGYFSSYAMTITGEKLYFIFNDSQRNYEPSRSGGGHTFNGSRSTIILATISTNGEVDLSPLFNGKEEGIVTRPKVCKQISKNKMMVYGESKKRFKFGKLLF